MNDRFISRFTGRTAICSSLFLFVFFSRAWLIKVWGSPLPYWDQWDSEGAHLLRPWIDGTIRWQDFFVAQNEHRIVLSRVADLALFTASGRWNMWWELTFNAFLHASIAAMITYFFWPMLAGANRIVALSGLALVFVAPCGWQNALWGFQSHVYLCLLVSFLALAGLLFHAPFKPQWWLGWFATVLALFTQAAGIFAAGSAIVTIVLVAWLDRISLSKEKSQIESTANPLPGRGRTIAGVFALLIVIALGWALMGSPSQHSPMRAQSMMQFGKVMARCMGWPWVNSDWMWIVMQAPSFWFAVRLIRQGGSRTTADRFVLGLIILTALNGFAIAYSRGAGLVDSRPLSRYQDPLFLGVVTNLFLALRLGSQHRLGRPVALLFFGALLTGLIPLSATNLSLNLPYKRQHDTVSLLQVRTYLSTHDGSVFTKDPNFPGPHPQPEALRKVLDDPILIPILPAEIADPSIRPPSLITSSPWLLAASLGLFLLVLVTSALATPTPAQSR